MILTFGEIYRHLITNPFSSLYPHIVFGFTFDLIIALVNSFTLAQEDFLCLSVCLFPLCSQHHHISSWVLRVSKKKKQPNIFIYHHHHHHTLRAPISIQFISTLVSISNPLFCCSMKLSISHTRLSAFFILYSILLLSLIDQSISMKNSINQQLSLSKTS